MIRIEEVSDIDSISTLEYKVYGEAPTVCWELYELLKYMHSHYEAVTLVALNLFSDYLEDKK